MDGFWAEEKEIILRIGISLFFPRQMWFAEFGSRGLVAWMRWDGSYQLGCRLFDFDLQVCVCASFKQWREGKMAWAEGVWAVHILQTTKKLIIIQVSKGFVAKQIECSLRDQNRFDFLAPRSDSGWLLCCLLRKIDFPNEPKFFEDDAATELMSLAADVLSLFCVCLRFDVWNMVIKICSIDSSLQTFFR